MMMDMVLLRAVRQGFKHRNESQFPSIRGWRRDDLRETIKAYRMIVNTEVANVD